MEIEREEILNGVKYELALFYGKLTPQKKSKIINLVVRGNR